MDALAEYRDRMRPFGDIKGCAFKSYNFYHDGVDELIYEVGLLWELEQLGYKVHRQKEFPVYYKGAVTDICRRMDLVVETPKIGNIILELKSVNYVEDKHRKQLWSYMRLTDTTYGMLINFGPKGVYTETFEYDSQSNSCYRITTN